MKILRNSAPGPDEITASITKINPKVIPHDLLAIINHSNRHCFILLEWRITKIIPLIKKHIAGFTSDKIRSISLTSNLAKTN